MHTNDSGQQPLRGSDATDGLSVEQQRILEQVQCTFFFMGADPEESERLRPWLSYQLEGFLETLTYGDLEMPELMAAVAVLGPAFSRLLGDTHAAQPLPTLRAVGD